MRENNNPLLMQIQTKKEEMYACARETGYSSFETIECSQELDQLIYEYQLSTLRNEQAKSNDKHPFRQLFWFLGQPQTSVAGSFES
jgi:hypothetical protein